MQLWIVLTGQIVQMRNIALAINAFPHLGLVHFQKLWQGGPGRRWYEEKLQRLQDAIISRHNFSHYNEKVEI